MREHPAAQPLSYKRTNAPGRNRTCNLPITNRSNPGLTAPKGFVFEEDRGEKVNRDGQSGRTTDSAPSCRRIQRLEPRLLRPSSSWGRSVLRTYPLDARLSRLSGLCLEMATKYLYSHCRERIRAEEKACRGSIPVTGMLGVEPSGFRRIPRHHCLSVVKAKSAGECEWS